ncbi:MAG: PLP-dependent aminotransferase family protein [Vicinamibacteria bacterium]
MDTRTEPMVTLARRMELLDASRVVTEILKLAERPDVISLAGGLPDPAVFPLERVRECQERVLREEGAMALNYGPNPGFTRLREWIAARMESHEDVTLGVDNVLVTSGGIEALNLAATAILNPGDTVLVEAPTYLAALHVFRSHEARIESVPFDGDGLDPAALREKVKELAKAGVKPRFLYVIPSFQNPSGATWSASRRRLIAAFCQEVSIPLIEDHAYAELCYEGEREPSLKSISPENVVFIHTFSKIFAPGARLGWVAAGRDLTEKLGLVKLGTDQCANTLTQRLVYDYGRRGYIEDQIAGSIELYRRKRDRMEQAMKRHFPPEARWIHPRGGFFVWVAIGEEVDTEALLPLAIEKEKTAFVAGPPFYSDGSGKNFMRLSFSYVPEERIEEGIERIGRAIRALQS